MRSLLALDYPDYEVIVVDDGSSDNTPAILARYPVVRVIRQTNHGLSVARNVGLGTATGSIIAYTDSDCYADRDWLTHLVHQLQRTGAAAVGGPNLAPEDGWLAACVAASPGQPMHVLESDQVAEHVPGCNMAFRRDALEAINAFDPQYQKAGDDVDICWRLQQAGLWITFAPGAFVWHHRRQTPRAYLRQQGGYGEAEALLQFKHPDRFNGRGDGKWRGRLYGASLQGLRLGQPIIYHGTFGGAPFQSIYQPGPAHWAMLPSTLEWHVAGGFLALAGFLWPPAYWVIIAMLVLSFAVAGLQARQAVLARPHEGLRARLLIMLLCYVQPLVRSYWRYRTRLFCYCPPKLTREVGNGQYAPVALSGRQQRDYWSETGCERTALLRSFLAHLLQHRWGTTIDSGWSFCDLEIYAHPWTRLQLCTAEENHGGPRRLIRARYRLRWNPIARALALVAASSCVLLAVVSPVTAVLAGGLVGIFLLAVWRQGLELGSRVIESLDEVALRQGLSRCDPTVERLAGAGG
jgi:GT2 family glycosyltransferase